MSFAYSVVFRYSLPHDFQLPITGFVQKEVAPIQWQYHSFKCIGRLLTLLPYSWILALGRWLGAGYYLLAAKQRNRALNQIQEHMQLALPQAQAVIKSSFVKLAQTFLEVLYTPVLTPQNVHKFVTLENEHYLKECMAEGKGVISLNAHFGNWEWMGSSLALYGYPVVAIIKPQPNKDQTELINEYRCHAGIEVFSKGNETIGAIKALKQGKVVSFFSDQDAGRNGIFVPFFAKMAATPQGAAVFAKKLKLPVVPMFMLRRPEGGHRFIMQEPLFYQDTGHEEEDMEKFIAKLTKVIENIIREYPDEWVWFLRRWRTEYSNQQERGGEQGE